MEFCVEAITDIVSGTVQPMCVDLSFSVTKVNVRNGRSSYIWIGLFSCKSNG